MNRTTYWHKRALFAALLTTVFFSLPCSAASLAAVDEVVPPQIVQGSDTFAADWWKSAVIYQVYLRSFYDSDGDGVGDIEGIIAKLDYLKSIQIDALWLSPVHPSPNADYGYDVADYYQVDKRYGSLETFDRLVAACKERGIALVMDLVVNHTSNQHPWFKNALAGGDKEDWYLWRGANGEGGPPNNWVSRMGLNQSAWTWSPERTAYYMHSFLAEQPDLNWRNPEVRAEIKKIMDFWLQRGVKGFRLDVLNYYLKDEKFRSNPERSKWHLFLPVSYTRSWADWVNQVGQSVFYAYAGQQHLYDKDQVGVLDILREFRQTVAPYHGVILGEVDSEPAPEKSAAYYGGHGEGVHLAFNMNLLELPWEARRFYIALNQWQNLLPLEGWPALTFSNHDRMRSFSRYGSDRAKAKILLTILMTMRGTPVVYYGEEIGMKEGSFSTADIKDPAYHAAKLPGVLAGLSWQGRDGCRTPMQWDESRWGGFSRLDPAHPGEVKAPWLWPNNRDRSLNVAQEERYPGALLPTFRALSKLRHSSVALQAGRVEFIPQFLEAGLLAYKRIAGSEEILVLANFSNLESQDFPLGRGEWEVLPMIASQSGETLVDRVRVLPAVVMLLRKK